MAGILKSLVLLERGSTNAATVALQATCSGIKIKDSEQKKKKSETCQAPPGALHPRTSAHTA